MTGRPSNYTPEIAREICKWLADGNSLRQWCIQEGKASFSTVYDWLEEHEDFAESYARARERQAHNDADRLNEITHQVATGALGQAEGRVMGDLLKWTAARRAPKAYGDKLALQGSDDGAPLVVTWLNSTK